MERIAIVLGATGMVGKEVVKQLLAEDEYSGVKVIHRRLLDIVHPKLEQVEVEFDRLEEYAAAFSGTDIYCCLGTTIKKAGSKENFKKVDLEYVVNAMEIASSQNVDNFMLISAMGASTNSSFFYNQVKGEAEERLKQFNFKKTGIFRPSILDGERQEERPGEQMGLKVMKALSFLFVGKWKKYAPIHAKEVAAGMIYFALQGQSGTHIFKSDEIKKLAEKKFLQQA